MASPIVNPHGHDSANDLLPFQDYTIGQFNRECLKLYSNREGEVQDEGCSKALVRLVHFAVSGRHPDHGHQAYVDALYFSPHHETEFRLTRDFDSLICWTTSLQHVTAPLHVHPVALYKNTIQRDVHVAKRFDHFPGASTMFLVLFSLHTLTPMEQYEGPISIDLHRIPNVGLGSLSERTSIKVFFPMLHDRERPNVALSQGEMKLWYDIIVRPAALAVAPAAAASWPVSYDAEMFRTQTTSGSHAFGSVMLAAADIPTFGNQIQYRLAQQDWGRQAFFLTDVRGHKDISRHDAEFDNESNELFLSRSELELENMTLGLNLGALYQMNTVDNWCYVDVGIEVKVERQSVFWRSDGHQHLLAEILPDWTEEERQRRTERRHSNYTRDPAAQFTEISGFRLTVGPD
jgi:hypothetical protein